MIAFILFWGSVALLVYTLVLFPLLVLVRGKIFPRSIRSAEITPSVSIIIAAHNEVQNIAKRIENLLALDYPKDRMEILIASDGSTDGTGDVVSGYSEQGVRLLSLPRGGKSSALNHTVGEAAGEILVFSDANCEFTPDALRALVYPFSDATVGGVAGNQVYLRESDSSLTAEGECAYWNFDRLMKHSQSLAGNVTSATGAIYAIRRSLYHPIPPGVTDDFVVSTNVISLGYRLVFDAEAVSREPVAVETGTEFGRKIRVITQGFHAIGVMRHLLNPFRYGFYSFQLFWHKVLRRVTVLPVILLGVTSVLLWNESVFYRVAACSQAMFYLCAVLGLVVRETRFGSFKLLTIPFYFCMVNTAAFLALSNVVLGRRIERWEPQRSANSSSRKMAPSTLQAERSLR